jgi:hypothetical protein
MEYEMPDGISKANARQSAKSKKSGRSRAMANLPAKAGRRKLPMKKGKHVTTHEERQRAMFLSQFGLKPFKNPWFSKKLIPMNDGAELQDEAA